MLREKAYTPYTAKEIRPEGWLRQQLQLEADGLVGNLDKIWPDVRDSRWIGGDREGWERVPYWLDGFIPLAYLLEDEDKIARAKTYVDAILAQQKPDGWLCPCPDEERGRYDMWALLLIGKVLVVYHDCSGDDRVEGALLRAFRQFYDHLKGNTLFGWGLYRWFEGLIPVYWLYERTGEEWLLDLAVMLYTQGVDFRSLFENWRDQIPGNNWGFQTHVVNLAMAYKAEALVSLMTEKTLDPDALGEKMFETLQEYHGMAVGHFTGDECLSGNSPIQGSELCSVVEAMYSFEVLFSVGGNPIWLDRLEQLAFNALPATTSPDMWTHQYDQQTNQIECSRFGEKVIFRTNGTDANLFGLEPNYGCCTANFGQGWPKFALAAFLHKEREIVSAALAPASLHTEMDGAAVFIKLDTLYPFRDTLTYTVTVSQPAEFTFGIRIPGFVRTATVDGRPAAAGEIFRLSRRWEGETAIEVVLDMEFAFVPRPEEMFALRRGPLFYSVAIEEDWRKLEYVKDGVERKFPYCDYEIFAKSSWNYAFASDHFVLSCREDFDLPFSTLHPPVELEASMYEILWGLEDGYKNVCARLPKERQPLGEACTVRMIPYGCTSLRMTEMPRLF